MTSPRLCGSRFLSNVAHLLAVVVILSLAAAVWLPAQNPFSRGPLRVPVFLELEHKAENVRVPLGPGMSEVLSSISITVRGSGSIETDNLEFMPGAAPPTGAGDFQVDSFFDITYRIEFEDKDPANDFISELADGDGKIVVRPRRGQSSRLEGSGRCTPDPASPNLGCVTQAFDSLIDPKDPALLFFEDVTRTMGLGITLSIPERTLQATLTEQIPLPGNQIFSDGFESGDVSVWSVSDGSSSSEFEVDASGTLELQEKVVIPGSELTNYFSLIGDGSIGGSGPAGLAERGGIKFTTSMIFTNTGPATDLRLWFFSPDNVELVLKLKGMSPDPAQWTQGSIFTTTLGTGESLSLETEGLEELQTGYARFRTGPSVGATAVFSLANSQTGATLYDAGVAAISRPLRRFTLFLNSMGVEDTGLAMVRVGTGNGSAATQGATPDVRMRLFDTDFQLVGTTFISLPENHQMSRFIHEYFADQPEVAEQAREMQGVVVVQSAGLLAPITLRLIDEPGNPTLSTFPVIEGSAESSMIQALQQAGRGNRR